MNREVHYELTRAWAIEEGFSADEADTIAQADWDVDRIFDGRKLRHKGYHFAGFGAMRRSRVLLGQAIRDGDLVMLGRALHCAQDATSHGFWGHVFHWHGIDRWAHRGPRVRERLQRRSKQLLAAYLERKTGMSEL